MTLLVLLALLVPGSFVQASQIVIVNNDPPGEGLNDPDSRDPVGGNSGTTLGEQRLIVLESAAALWAGQFDLTVEIRAGATFEALDCDQTGAVLGSAGPNRIARNFSGAPVADTWYTVAQADTLRGSSFLAADEEHIGTTFNVSLDESDPNCLGGNSWYYGLDGNVPSGTVPLFPVVLHELAHGLGFLTFVDFETGERLNGFNDAYMLFLRDNERGKLWPEMTNQERVDSALNDPRVVWTGPNVEDQSDMVTATSAFDDGRLRVHAPDELEPGSSISHFTPAADPPLLMEPSLNAGVFDQLDLTPALFADIGWPMSVIVDLIFGDRFEQQ